MNLEIAVRMIDRLIQAITFEINSIKSEVAGSIVMQVAIYSHDHIEADRPDFGVLSSGPTLDEVDLEELEQWKVVLLDREQRRNALRHLKHLLEKDHPEAVRLLREEMQRFFNIDEQYEFFFEPESEYPNEYVKPYPYT